MLRKITAFALTFVLAFAAITVTRPVAVRAEGETTETELLNGAYLDHIPNSEGQDYVLPIRNYYLDGDLELDKSIVIQGDAGQVTTIDLKGHSITFEETNPELGIKLNTESKLTIKNGTVKSSGDYVIVLSGDGSLLTIEEDCIVEGGVNFDSERSMVENNGSLTIPSGKAMRKAGEHTVLDNKGTLTNNGTINNRDILTNNSTLVNNGTINNDNDSALLTNDGTLTNTGTIENGEAPNNGTIEGNGTIINNGNGKISGVPPKSSVTVTRPATSVSVNPTSLNLKVGETSKLTPELQPRETTDTVTWSSNNPDIATVDTNGNVTANKAGSAVITATAGDVSATCNVTVSRLNPALSVEAVSTKVYSDTQFQLNVTHNSDGVVSYSSSDPNVLRVDGNGLVSIVNAGTAAITVSLPQTDKYDAASDTLNIMVDKATGSLSIQNAVINKTYGDPDFSVKPSDSTPGTIRYMADGSGVVSVDGDGNVHINKPGTAVITISMDATGNHHAVSEKISVIVAVGASGTIENPNYVITTGNKNNWQRGSNKPLVIISDGDYDLFNGLYIDGSLVDQSNYDLKKGSTEIYLHPSYLETLSVGRHTFELRYSNGKIASGEFTITEAAKPAEEKKGNETAISSPKTGDNAHSEGWGLMMLAAIICASGLVALKKKRVN